MAARFGTSCSHVEGCSVRKSPAPPHPPLQLRLRVRGGAGLFPVALALIDWAYPITQLPPVLQHSDKLTQVAQKSGWYEREAEYSGAQRARGAPGDLLTNVLAGHHGIERCSGRWRAITYGARQKQTAALTGSS